MERQPLRDKHQAWIDKVFANQSVPNDARTLINALLTDAEDIESERDELVEEVDELRDQVAARDSDQDRALEEVKYWLRDVLDVKPRDPRKLLRIVEAAL
jgi:outer membrane murein-binding lipoprotein Lpp